MSDAKHLKLYIPTLRKHREKEFTRWWIQFEAYAVYADFVEVLSDKKWEQLPETEVEPKGEKAKKHTDEEKAALKKNKTGIATFFSAFRELQELDCVSYIHASQTSEWPTGQCWEVVKELFEEFTPDNMMGMVNQKRELGRISMGKWDNPKTLFSQITEIDSKYRGRCSALTEEEKLCAIICKAPEQYNLLIQTVRSRSLETTGAEPSIKTLRKEMFDLYQQEKAKHVTKKSSKTKGTELSFYAGDDSDSEDEWHQVQRQNKSKKNQRKGSDNRKCYGCGQTGHIKRDCPKENRKPSAKCGHCGKPGHVESECWTKHPEKRPKWMNKKNKEIAGIVLDTELNCALIDGTQREDEGFTVKPLYEAAVEANKTVNLPRKCIKCNKIIRKDGGSPPLSKRANYKSDSERVKRRREYRRERGKPVQNLRKPTRNRKKGIPDRGQQRVQRFNTKFQSRHRTANRGLRKDQVRINRKPHGEGQPRRGFPMKGWSQSPQHTRVRRAYGPRREGRPCRRGHQYRFVPVIVPVDMRDYYRATHTKPEDWFIQPRRLNSYERIENFPRHMHGTELFNDPPGQRMRCIFNNRSRGRRTPEYNLISVEAGLEQRLSPALMSASGTDMLYSPIIWVADSGASCHVTNSDAGSVPAKRAKLRMKTNSHSLDASGNKMKTTAILNIRGTITNSDGTTTNINLQNCRYGASKFNLCSITKMMQDGWVMHGDDTGIYMRKGRGELHFNIPIETPEGKLWAVRIDRRDENDTPIEFNLATPTTMNLAKAHAYCGHSNIRRTKQTAKHLGWTITRTKFDRCEPCALGKARRANLGGGDQLQPENVGELWYVDGLRLKKPENAKGLHFPANNCLDMAVEHLSGASMIGWYATKSHFIQPFCAKFNDLKVNHAKTVRRIRCDDAGENTKFQTAINGDQWKMGVQFEFTAKTPQRNSRVETKLYQICCQTRAAMEAAHIPNKFRYIVFPMFLKWCCQTDSLAVITVHDQTKTREEHLRNKLPNWTRNMQVAGAAGVVKTHEGTEAKVFARGKTCMFVCYADDHAADCYVLFDPGTLRTVHSRDVLWLNRMYFPAKTTPGAAIHLASSGRFALGPSVEGSENGESSEVQSISTTVTTSESESEAESAADEQSIVSTNTNSTDESDIEREETQEWRAPEEEILFETDDSDNESDETNHENTDNDSESEAEVMPSYTTTRSGRACTRAMAKDGTRYYETAELAALSIEEDYCEEAHALGVQVEELSETAYYNAAMQAEEYALFQLMENGDQVLTSIEHAFGYTRKRKNRVEYMLVAAAVETERGELILVGATGKNYGNTAELNVMNYKQAMATVDKEEWNQAIKVEHDKMVKYNVFEVVNRKDLPPGTKLFDSTWAMKKKPDGTYRARNAIRGFMQVEGKHFDGYDKSSPVATETGIRVVFVLTIVANWYQHLVDVEGAFLNGVFQHPDKHKMYMKIPEAYKQWYPSWAVFLLKKTQYGTVQAALQYYRECCKALAFLKFKRNRAEPCMFYKWKNKELVIFLLWVDDCCISGPRQLVLETVREFKALWDCKDLGELEEYVGCKVERSKTQIKLTQPVKVQRFIDEFGCKGDNGPSHRAPSTPAEPGSVLEYNKEVDKPLNNKKQTKYRSGVGILLHMMRWSRPDVLNATRELSSHMQQAGKQCYKALMRVMNYIVATKDKGYTFKPTDPNEWNGYRDGRKFKIMGKCDSEYAKHTSRRSVNAGITYFEGAIVKQFSKMMPIVALSTTEAELYSAVLTAQDMMFVYHIVTNLQLEVELPMLLYCDNKGTVDLANNWSVGGRTRHIDVKQNFLRELKENGILRVEWRTGTDMTPDMHTKNVPKILFERYSAELVS